jgi:hypothetical protein
MKIKFISLFSFIFLTSQLFGGYVLAKENDAIISETDNGASAANTKVSAKSKKKVTDQDIKPFDFDKLFSDAEKYYKSAKAWHKIQCEPKSGFICNKHECNKREIKATLLLDKTAKTITRCEKNNCETFPAEFEQTGVYFNIQTKGPIGTLIRVLGDSRYKEITTVALDAYVANGECSIIE